MIFLAFMTPFLAALTSLFLDVFWYGASVAVPLIVVVGLVMLAAAGVGFVMSNRHELRAGLQPQRHRHA